MTRQPDPFPGLFTSIQDAIQDYLGTAATRRTVHRILTHILEQEAAMATITDALTRLAEQVNKVSAAQATSFSNLQNAVAALKRGELTAEQQTAVDQIERSLITLGEDAQRADDDVEPTEDTPAEPVEPVEPGPDTDAAAELAADVPAEGTQETPTDTGPADNTATRRRTR